MRRFAYHPFGRKIEKPALPREQLLNGPTRCGSTFEATGGGGLGDDVGVGLAEELGEGLADEPSD
ncbi:MAG: hypothetical protein M3473_00930 [Chloroflexota bacterium]|jgi:hypothetical protein|nr:hypothetical protein [Chloroflexota bacterium]